MAMCQNTHASAMDHVGNICTTIDALRQTNPGPIGHGLSRSSQTELSSKQKGHSKAIAGKHSVYIALFVLLLKVLSCTVLAITSSSLDCDWLPGIATNQRGQTHP